MKVHRIDHVGIVVNDLPAAKAFFLDLGLEVLGETEVKGEWVERVIGLNDVRDTVVMLGMPDGEANIGLTGIHPYYRLGSDGMERVCYGRRS
ncbi:MAG: hypothetical protein J5U17_06540 [Candidatus Methanoperedens sp.]|nr:hypothetical protein [Candidatus Methanoperedens sp.]MCE8427846.1 hypothetical protein [Candidatus Methanoperedens sp.]